tara:strand:+ start:715 stop:1380 length:666 start_codon:yes stop_codon:yes gene_type:complete
MDRNIKLILVDDEVLFRKGISFLLDREEKIKVIHEASNGKELLSFLENSKIHPDIIIMDLKMPLLNGVEATKVIHKEYPKIKIIALSSYRSKSFVANLMHLGAVSYLVKNTTPKELLKTIHEVNSKGFYYDDYVMKVIKDIALSDSIIDKELKSNYLTSREVEVLQLICEQKTTSEIAELLFISPRTVDGHRNNLLLKTESKNIAGLVFFAIQNKIVLLYD